METRGVSDHNAKHWIMSRGATPPAPTETSDGFGSTVWSLVLNAAHPDDNGAALDRLCRKYWRPVFVYVRKSGFPPADAEDATQEFFLYLLERSWLKQVAPERGSFRAFLLVLLKNFLANHRRRENALKRAIARPDFFLNVAGCEHELAALASTEIDAAKAYERSWANCVLQSALGRLSDEQTTAGKSEIFQAVRPYLQEPPSAGDYEQLAQRLGMPRGRVAVLVHRLSRRFGELVRIEMADTLADRTSVDAELRHLLLAIGN